MCCFPECFDKLGTFCEGCLRGTGADVGSRLVRRMPLNCSSGTASSSLFALSWVDVLSLGPIPQSLIQGRFVLVCMMLGDCSMLGCFPNLRDKGSTRSILSFSLAAVPGFSVHILSKLVQLLW